MALIYKVYCRSSASFSFTYNGGGEHVYVPPSYCRPFLCTTPRPTYMSNSPPSKKSSSHPKSPGHARKQSSSRQNLYSHARKKSSLRSKNHCLGQKMSSSLQKFLRHALKTFRIFSRFVTFQIDFVWANPGKKLPGKKSLSFVFLGNKSYPGNKSSGKRSHGKKSRAFLS